MSLQVTGRQHIGGNPTPKPDQLPASQGERTGRTGDWRRPTHDPALALGARQGQNALSSLVPVHTQTSIAFLHIRS